jgi:hypothetical protein
MTLSTPLRRTARLAAALLLGGSLLGSTPAYAGGGRDSLPRVPSGALPGPGLLYADPVVAPPLRNAGPWRARPILVSGATAYRRGEWLYQDFLQDDHGARGVPDPSSPYDTETHTYSPPFGSFTYPDDPAYADNAADLVELRVKPLARATAFRVTFNTMKDPARAAFTIALGGEEGASVPWPHGAGVSSPARLFLTWHGDTAELATPGGTLTSPTGAIGVDVHRARHQVEVRVPHALWNPGRRTVRTTIGTGLWDQQAGRYLAPAAGPRTATTPGGGTPTGTAIVNVGPRLDEPQPLIAGATIADTAVGAAATTAFWRERQQGTQLALGDVAPFSAEVDFGKLHRRVRDDSAVPRRGSINRILSSRFSFGQGIDPSTECFSLSSAVAPDGPSYAPARNCTGRFAGPLQAYTVYVPRGPKPQAGWGLTMLMHSLSANHNQYSASRNQSQLGERAGGSVVVTPGGRGPDGFYAGAAEADLFETWADVAARYDLQPRWAAASGYSMGGFGTYRMLARWPDLFGRGFAVVGLPGTVSDQLRSLRHNPLMTWTAAEDELVPLAEQRAAVDGLTDAGVRFDSWTFGTADHLTLAANDEYAPGAAYLGHALTARDPRHVTYVVDRREDTRIGRVRADHAWWLSRIRPADPRQPGTVDARSLASRRGTPRPQDVVPGAGVLTGGQDQALAYASEHRGWGRAPRARARNVLRLRTTNVERLVVDVRRAGLTCGARVRVRTDSPVTVVLRGCDRRVSARPR